MQNQKVNILIKGPCGLEIIEFKLEKEIEELKKKKKMLEQKEKEQLTCFISTIKKKQEIQNKRLELVFGSCPKKSSKNKFPLKEIKNQNFTKKSKLKKSQKNSKSNLKKKVFNLEKTYKIINKKF